MRLVDLFRNFTTIIGCSVCFRISSRIDKQEKNPYEPSKFKECEEIGAGAALRSTPFLTAGLLDSFAELTVKCRAHPLVQ
jgi:hypothetical protein